VGNIKPWMYLLAAGGLILLGSRVVKAFAPLADFKLPPGARRVACLGDSLTANGVYCKQLKNYLPTGSLTKTFGYANQGTAYILKKLPKVLAWNPTDIVVLAGVNDLPRNGGDVTVISNLEKIYAQAHAAGVRVVAVKILPWHDYPSASGHEDNTYSVNDWIMKNSTADVYVDSWALGDAGYALLSEFTTDGLHLNAAGYRFLAKLISDQAFVW